MRTLIAAVTTLLAFNVSTSVWAGPIEEVAEIAKARQQSFVQGNADAYTAAFADNAVLQSSFSPFRIEGKEAVRAFFAHMFQIYPKRSLFIRQPAARAYGEDLVVHNAYSALNLVNSKGEHESYHTRSNTIWKKLDGRWQIIDQHISRLPTAH